MDWKQFHRVVSRRDAGGRRHTLYALPETDGQVGDGDSRKLVTEEEAQYIDWMKYHRIGGPRDPLTGKRSSLYELPSKRRHEH